MRKLLDAREKSSLCPLIPDCYLVFSELSVLVRCFFYFPLGDSTFRLLFELWLNYRELLKAHKMICNLFT